MEYSSRWPQASASSTGNLYFSGVGILGDFFVMGIFEEVLYNAKIPPGKPPGEPFRTTSVYIRG